MNYLIKLIAIVSLLGILTDGQAQYYIGGYIRPDRLETGQISADILKKHTDLMLLGFHPKSNGRLQVTDHQATFANGVNILGNFDGRSGVVSFNGQSGAIMNGKEDLLVSNKTFTFTTFLYTNGQSTFVPGKFIFKKQEGSKEISLRVGGSYGQLIFRVIDNGVSYQATANATITGILADQWNHVGLTFNGAASQGSQIKLFVNGVEKTMSTSSTFPAILPTVNGNFMLGENLDGYLDEVLVNDLALNSSDINQFYAGNYPFNTFNHTKTVAFWNFDDVSNPGKDLRSHVTLFNRIKSMIAGTDIKLYLTISGGEWQTAISTAAGRTNFANDINAILIDQNLDGVDVDLEWPQSNTDAAFANYSTFVLKLREVIGNTKELSLSLHPAYYRASLNAIQASDYVALQMYGPSTTWWSYTKYVEAAQAALAYGIPAQKLIMGLPFFATTGVAGEQVGYRDIIAANPSLDFGIDQILFNSKNYTFNGVNTIEKKAQYVCQNNLAGIMAWDIPLDMLDYNSSHSLLKAAIKGLNSCDSSSITVTRASYENDILNVDWTTNETNGISHFLVEMSIDKKSFQVIDSITVNKGLNKTSYSSQKNVSNVDMSISKAAFSLYSILILCCCLLRFGTSSISMKNILVPCLAIVVMCSGCSKQLNTELDNTKKAQFIRIVSISENGDKNYSAVKEVLR